MAEVNSVLEKGRLYDSELSEGNLILLFFLETCSQYLFFHSLKET